MCDNATMFDESATALYLLPWPPDFEYKQTTGFGVRYEVDEVDSGGERD